MSFDSLVNRILKIIAVVGLISLATCVVLVEIAVLKDGRPHVTWHWHVGAILMIWLCFWVRIGWFRDLPIRPTRFIARVVMLSGGTR